MSSIVNTLNLRPQEKRVIVILAVIVFAVLNVLLVFPHFHDWSKINRELLDTQASIATRTGVIEKDTNSSSNGWKNKLHNLTQTKDGVIPQFSEIALQKTVTDEARKCGVQIQSYQPVTPLRLGPSSQADKYFESESVRIAVQCQEANLIQFLYNVGNDPAMIRVRELSLRPLDANRFQLSANITLTADYQKNVDTNVVKKPTIQTGSPVGTSPGAAQRAIDNRPGVNRSNAVATNRPPARRSAAPPIMPPVPGAKPNPVRPQ